MVATVNLPGSSRFAYFVGKKADCERWLERKKEEYQNLYGGTWWGCYAPARITSNREARRWKYLDGSRVVRPLEGRC